MGSSPSRNNVAVGQPTPLTTDGQENRNVATNFYQEKQKQQSKTGSLNLRLAQSVPSIIVSAKKLAAAKRKEKEDAKKKILEEFPELADALDCVKNWMKEINEDRDEDVKKNTMSLRSKRWLDELYVLYFDNEHTEHKKILGDQIAKERGGYTFTEYIKGLTDSGKNTPTTGYKYECSEMLRAVCWNYSDASLEFCVELGRNGMFPLAVADLNNFRKDFEDTHIRANIILPSLSILHNCAKAPDNKKYMKDAAVVDAIVPYTKVDEPEIKMIAMMGLAYIIDEEDNHIISTDGTMIKFILSYLKGALASRDHKYEGFSAHEIVAGLMHLASNDSNKTTIVNEGILPMLVELMQKGEDSEKAQSAKTVWVLSFAQENKDKIKNEPNMMEALKDLSNSPGTKENASGALWVLDNETRIRSMREASVSEILSSSSLKGSFFKQKAGGKKDRRTSSKMKEQQSPPESLEREKTDEATNEFFFAEESEDEVAPPPPQVASSKPKHIMLSYQWGCQKLMLKIKNNLQQRNYRVWMDVDEMGGSTLQAMAEAVENSEVVLVGMSQKYKESPNCRTEAEYAYQLGKTLIPLRVEPMYRPDGWLGALQGAKFYFDFSNLITFENVFSKLMKELEDKVKVTSIKNDVIMPAGAIHTHSPPPVLQPPALPTLVVNWSKEQIREWATTHKISSRKIWNLDGDSLNFLNGMRKIAPEFFFKYISERLGLTELRDIMNLWHGLDALS